MQTEDQQREESLEEKIVVIPESVPKKSRRKMVIRGGIIIGLVLVVSVCLRVLIGGVSMEKDRASTEGWVEYVNEKYDYKIKYPPNLEVSDNDSVYIYDPREENTGLNRYITIEPIDALQEYGDYPGLTTETVRINNFDYAKTSSPGAPSDAYTVSLYSKKGYLKILVSNSADRAEVANIMLNTLELR